MKKRAFTLIEMMIAIFIISMLLVMAVPKYERVMLKSRTEEAKSIIQSIIFAQERYKQEMGNFYPTTDGSTISNEEVISQNLKIDLSKSNNFNYFITDLTGTDDGNFTIKAVLRIDNGTCSTTSDTICKQNGTAGIDNWVSQYNRGENRHFIEFRYPNKLRGDFVEGGISYENLYDN